MIEVMFGEDYKNEIHELIGAMFDEVTVTTRQQRLGACDTIIESYVLETGEAPDASALHRMGTLLLNEEYSDMSRSKVADADFPFLSVRQMQRRDSREFSSDISNRSDGAVTGYKKATFTNADGTDINFRQAIRIHAR